MVFSGYPGNVVATRFGPSAAKFPLSRSREKRHPFALVMYFRVRPLFRGEPRPIPTISSKLRRREYPYHVRIITSGASSILSSVNAKLPPA